jgi:hypothetical protein
MIKILKISLLQFFEIRIVGSQLKIRTKLSSRGFVVFTCLRLGAHLWMCRLSPVPKWATWAYLTQLEFLG